MINHKKISTRIEAAVSKHLAIATDSITTLITKVCESEHSPNAARLQLESTISSLSIAIMAVNADTTSYDHHRRQDRRQQPVQKVNSSRFYGEYHGHRVEHLEPLLLALREESDSLIWTAGDSSLDNKYWFSDARPAPSGAYQRTLDPPTSNADVTYWLNVLSQERQERRGRSLHQKGVARPRIAAINAINAAVEATTLNERTWRLRPQDRFLRDHIQPNDVLVVSVGGNDVALAPLPCTIVSILSLMSLPGACLERGCILGTVPSEEYCCGCGPSALLSCTSACPPCFGYMVHLFGTRVEKYIDRLTAKARPKNIFVCMIYYPDEAPTPSWAGPALGCLRYDSDPQKLQTLIRRAFVEGTSKISIPGSEVIPVPLFNVLDGKDSRDYIARVEPSPQGGRKMAEYLLDMIEKSTTRRTVGTYRADQSPTSTAAPVGPVYMADRT